MEDNFLKLYTDFNQKAGDILFRLYDEFVRDSQSVKRTDNENVFQLLRSRYSYTFQQELESCALGLLRDCVSSSLADKLELHLRAKIEFYVSEFMRKSQNV